MDNTPIVQFENVEAGYGRTRILNSLSFRVTEGEVFGVIGPNGCGKTTMLMVLSGFITCSSGRVMIFGREMTNVPPYLRCRKGIGRTWQVPRPFGQMTVFDSILTSAVHGGGMTAEKAGEEALLVLKETGLYDKADSMAGELTLLDRKRLELARALAAKPELLLLDETAAGLTEAESGEIMELVAKLKEKKYTIIWIEHNIELMLGAADRLMCMAEGQNVICGDPKEVMDSRIVEELYLGVDK